MLKHILYPLVVAVSTFTVGCGADCVECPTDDVAVTASMLPQCDAEGTCDPTPTEPSDDSGTGTTAPLPVAMAASVKNTANEARLCRLSYTIYPAPYDPNNKGPEVMLFDGWIAPNATFDSAVFVESSSLVYVETKGGCYAPGDYALIRTILHGVTSRMRCTDYSNYYPGATLGTYEDCQRL